MDDGFDLQRFVEAQDPVFERVCAELRAGHKTSHWMWFVFPQIRGLGSSEMSRRFAIGSPEEAVAYLRHPILGPRLGECARLLLGVEGRSAMEIFGPADTLKLKSCMTLFASVAPDPTPFRAVLDRYFAGAMDGATLERL